MKLALLAASYCITLVSLGAAVQTSDDSDFSDFDDQGYEIADDPSADSPLFAEEFTATRSSVSYLTAWPRIASYMSVPGDCIFDLNLAVGPGGVDILANSTVKACAARCSATTACLAFVFDPMTKQCELKDSASSCTMNPYQPTRISFEKQSVPDDPNNSRNSADVLGCNTNAGKTFYAAFMANRPEQPKRPPLELWVTQDETLDLLPIKVETISGVIDSFDLDYRQVHEFSLNSMRFQMTDEGDVLKDDSAGNVIIEPKVIKVSTSGNGRFVMYGVNKEYYTSDAFLSYPVEGLGKRYFASCHWPPTYCCEILIASTKDSGPTHVKVKLPYETDLRTPANLTKIDRVPCVVGFNGSYYWSGETFAITLNPWESAQIQAYCDLTGAEISADDLIAVWSGNVRAAVGEGMDTRDLLSEQLPPVNQWGTECAAFPTPNRTIGDYWTLTAAQDNTTVNIYKWYPDDSSVVDPAALHDAIRLNAGESWRFLSHTPRDWMLFRSEKPFMAVSYIHSQTRSDEPADPSMTVCIPTSHFASGGADDFGYTFVTPTGVATNYTNYVSVVIKKGKQNGLIIEGLPVSWNYTVDWQDVPMSDLVGGYLQLYRADRNRQEFRIQHREDGTPFQAYIYGAGDRESIAYAAGSCILSKCVLSVERAYDGDQIDNDCDGVVDEEIRNNLDDDFDGLIDEDCFTDARTLTGVIRQAPSTRPSANTTPATIPTTTRPTTTTSTTTASTTTTVTTVRPTTTAKTIEPNSNDFCLKPMQQSVACYGNQIALRCGTGLVVKVFSAQFGQNLDLPPNRNCSSVEPTNPSLSALFGSSAPYCETVDVYSAVASACDGRQACTSLPATLTAMGSPQMSSSCRLCSLSASVHYACISDSDRQSFVLTSRSGSAAPYRYAASSWMTPTLFVDSLMTTSKSACSAGNRQSLFCDVASSNLAQDNVEQFAPWQGIFSSTPRRAWRPDACNVDDQPWLQVDLGAHYQLLGYAVQGCRYVDYWVTSFTISYSNDAVTWRTLTDPNNKSQPIVFQGNVDARGIVYCSLGSYGIRARFVRFVVKSYKGYPCLHVDIARGLSWIGCPQVSVRGSQNFEIGGTAAPGETVTVRCKNGRTTEDGLTSYRMLCEDTADWATDFKQCTEVAHCSDIPQLQNGYHDGANNFVGSRVTYRCLPGYAYSSSITSQTIECGADGRWQPNENTLTTCVPIK